MSTNTNPPAISDMQALRAQRDFSICLPGFACNAYDDIVLLEYICGVVNRDAESICKWLLPLIKNDEYSLCVGQAILIAQEMTGRFVGCHDYAEALPEYLNFAASLPGLASLSKSRVIDILEFMSLAVIKALGEGRLLRFEEQLSTIQQRLEWAEIEFIAYEVVGDNGDIEGIAKNQAADRIRQYALKALKLPGMPSVAAKSPAKASKKRGPR